MREDAHDQQRTKMNNLKENLQKDLFLDAESKEKILSFINTSEKIQRRNNEETTIKEEKNNTENTPNNSETNVKEGEDLQNKNSTKTTREEDKLKKVMEDIYISGIHPKPEPLQPLVKFLGQNFLSLENIGLIVARAGMGKSSICESILASMHNPECDSLGFKISDEVNTALFFDFERDFHLVEKSNQRMWRRINNPPREGKTAIIVGMRKIYSLEDKKNRIIELVNLYKPQLIIIDGIGDLVLAPNNEEECAKLYLWLIKLITENKLSILSTIHPNAGGEKARGHLGSEMIRRCEGSVWVTENIDRTIKTISTTKERQSEPLKTSFKWDKVQGNNVSCDTITTGIIKKPPLIESLSIDEVYRLKQSFATGEKGKEEKGKLIGGYTIDKFGEVERKLKDYIKENHPELNGGTNAIGNLIKDLTNKGHLHKLGNAPNTKYTFTDDKEDKLLNLGRFGDLAHKQLKDHQEAKGEE
jgi:hypothetical protein